MMSILTVSDSVPINLRFRMLHSTGMYLLNIYRTRGTLRAASGDRHAYWISFPMQSSRSYASNAVWETYQHSMGAERS